MVSSTLIKSLSRLYKNGVLTKVQIAERVDKGTITAEDYTKITGESFNTDNGPAAEE